MTGGVLWVSTDLQTRGGVASSVRALQQTPLRDRWDIHHVATHREGSTAVKVLAFATGAGRFAWELLARRPRLVHLHSASYGSFARKSMLAWASYSAGVPVVLHVHGGAFLDFYEACPGWARRYVRATLERAEVVVALGDTWAARLRSVAPGAAVSVVPNGVCRRPMVRQPGPDEPVRVLFLGAVCEDKGAFVLLDAWARVLAGPDRPRAVLVLAGDGEVARARERVCELGLGEVVEVSGWVSRAEVEQLLQQCQVLVLPSRAEGQPMAVLEAMAAGLCVVVTPVGGVPDVVGDCAVEVAVDDGVGLAAALRQVVGDRELRVRLGRAGRDRVEQLFDLDQVWRRVDEIYRETAR